MYKIYATHNSLLIIFYSEMRKKKARQICCQQIRKQLTSN